MLYPINLDIAGKVCLVVGGGKVAARKIDALLLCGAGIRVVSPVACRAIRILADDGRIDWLQRDYLDSDILDAALVFAATDNSEVQQRVAEHAARWGVLLNSADNPDTSDFQVPAKVRRGEFLVTVSTSGSSPALATLIKQRLETEFGPEYSVLVGLMSRIRSQVVGGTMTSEENKELFHEVLKRPILDCIKEKKWNRLEELLCEVLPAGIDCTGLVRELEHEAGGQPT